jgi:hypothetical protein
MAALLQPLANAQQAGAEEKLAQIELSRWPMAPAK